MYEADTIAKLIDGGDASATALEAPGRQALSYDRTRVLKDRTMQSLNRMGVGRGDRVAIVLPNGPEMAGAFVSIASAATAAPLNPGYRQNEFDFYLSDLHAKALVVAAGIDSPARAAAAARGIPIVELVADSTGPAGEFSLRLRLR